MTLRQVYQKGKVLLEKAGIETPAFDAGSPAVDYPWDGDSRRF